jgi:protease-4
VTTIREALGLLGIAVVLVLLVLGSLLVLSVAVAGAVPDKPDILEVVPLTGEIGMNTVEFIARAVESVNENPRVKAVLLVVDTPGGGAVAAAQVYEELGRLKVPVVAWCNVMCASGGYYAIMAPSVKLIGVRSETISGSVGAIITVHRFHRLLDWAKIDVETYKSGELKDAGNPTRPGNPTEHEYIQGLVDVFAHRFYEVVDKARGKHITDWPAVRSARIFVGAQAQAYGLVDRVMSFDEAVRAAKELSGSKTIFTRDELRKMSRQADERPAYTAPAAPDLWQTITRWVTDLRDLVDEIRRGESVRILYRLPLETQ